MTESDHVWIQQLILSQAFTASIFADRNYCFVFFSADRFDAFRSLILDSYPNTHILLMSTRRQLLGSFITHSQWAVNKTLISTEYLLCHALPPLHSTYTPLYIPTESIPHQNSTQVRKSVAVNCTVSPKKSPEIPTSSTKKAATQNFAWKCKIEVECWSVATSLLVCEAERWLCVCVRFIHRADYRLWKRRKTTSKTLVHVYTLQRRRQMVCVYAWERQWVCVCISWIILQVCEESIKKGWERIRGMCERLIFNRWCFVLFSGDVLSRIQ